MEKGFVHIYYGDGKGKTSAAIGLIVRAVGAGMKVFLARFLKDDNSCELSVLKTLNGVTLGDCPHELPFWFVMKEEEKQSYRQYATALFKRAQIESSSNDVVVLDEFLDAVELGIVDKQKALDFVASFPKNTELVLTGHSIPDGFEQLAHYVSFVKAQKHPYQEGVLARRGIEY